MENNMLENMGSMMQIMSKLDNFSDGDLQGDDNKLSKYFVDDYNHSAINGIKSCLPYLDFKYQKNLTIFLKLIEMQRIIDMYKEQSEQKIISKQTQLRSMLKAVKPHLKDNRADMVDKMIKFMYMKEMMETMASTANKEA